MARVLVVDDDTEYLNVIASGLNALGHEVTAARDAAEAKEILEVRDFDVIFLDVVMRGGGAITLVHDIRKTDRETPIVIISGVSGVVLSPLFTEGFSLAQARLKKSASLYEINNLISSLADG